MYSGKMISLSPTIHFTFWPRVGSNQAPALHPFFLLVFLKVSQLHSFVSYEHGPERAMETLGRKKREAVQVKHVPRRPTSKQKKRESILNRRCIVHTSAMK